MVIIHIFSFFDKYKSKKKDQANAWSISFALALNQNKVAAVPCFEANDELTQCSFRQKPQAGGGNGTQYAR